ncbi:endonuclease/exonuclease/phosphatase family protein [Desulfocicer niacini]
MTFCLDFTVMTMNLRFGLAKDGKNNWFYRKNVLKQFLDLHQADFMGFQEANHFQMGFLQRQLKNHFFIGWHNLALQWWQSNGIFFRTAWRCLEQQHYFLSHTPKVQSKLSGSKWPRQCVIGLFENQGYMLIMANTHFDFDEPVQEESAQLVLSFLDDFPAGTPVIITGDFNASPGSAAYQVFKAWGFSEVFENNYASTFHEFKGRDTQQHIDWILYRGPFRVTHREILTSTFNGQHPSDHYPVASTFSF